MHKHAQVSARAQRAILVNARSERHYKKRKVVTLATAKFL